MGLFSRLTMNEEELQIQKEVKKDFSDFKDLLADYRRWLSNCNSHDNDYQKILSFREIDENMLKSTNIDNSINRIEEIFNKLNKNAQPFVEFANKLESQNINLNNLNLNEKKLILNPLKNNLQHIKEWNTQKELFRQSNREFYDGIISTLASQDISSIENYALTHINMKLNNKNDIVEKVKLIENVLLYGANAADVYDTAFSEKFEQNEELENKLESIYSLYDYVDNKFPETKEDTAFLSTVDKKLKAAKKMWYYSDILNSIVPCLEEIHKNGVKHLSVLISYAENDRSEELSALGISLIDIISLMGISPEYTKERIYTEQASYAGRTLTIKKFYFGYSLFTEVNGVLVSIQYDPNLEPTLEEKLAADTVGFKF